jgi:hypothetical protein
LPSIRVGLEPPRELNGAYTNRYLLSALLSLEENQPPEYRLPLAELASLGLAAYLDRCFQAPSADGPLSMALIFDQVEDVLTLDPTDLDAKEAFFRDVGKALRAYDRFALFAMREDYVGSLEPYLAPIPNRLNTRFRLDLLSAAQASQALQLPARAAGVDFTNAAAQKLVDDLRGMQVQRPDGSLVLQLGPYVEPVQLQVVGYRLWDSQVTGDAAITEKEVAALGDVSLSLAEYYAQCLETVARDTHISERLLRRWIERQLITEQGIRGQVVMGVGQSEGLDNLAIARLVDFHLVRAEKHGGATWYELAHDRLIAPVRKNNAAWFEEHLTLLQRQTELWEKQRMPDSLLLIGKDLQTAEAWAKDHAAELLPLERDFLAACRKSRAAERERQRNRLVRVLAVVASLAAIAALIFGTYALQTAQVNASLARTAGAANVEAQKNLGTAQANVGTAQANVATATANVSTAQANATRSEANLMQQYVVALTQQAGVNANAATQHAIALTQSNVAATAQAELAVQTLRESSRALAFQARESLNTDPVLALLLGIEAYRVFSTTEAVSALGVAIEQKLSRTTEQYSVWAGLGGTVQGVAFSPDGSLLAVAVGSGSVVLIDVKQQRQVGTFKGYLATAYGVAFSRDGKILAAAGSASQDPNHGTVVMWNTATPWIDTPVYEIGAGFQVLSVAFSPKVNRLAYGLDGNTFVVWDLDQQTRACDSGQVLRNAVLSVAWSPDGKQIATGSADHQVAIWDSATCRQPQMPTESSAPKDVVWSVAWSPDGQRLASASRDGSISLWDAKTNPLVGQVLTSTGQAKDIFALAFSGDGKLLASAHSDHSVLLWNMTTRTLSNRLAQVHTAFVRSVAFASLGNGYLLASGGADRRMVLQKVAPEQPSEQSIDQRACELAGRNFSQAEWSLFLSGQPYRVTCDQWPAGP